MGDCALLMALLGFSPAVGLVKGSCSPWELWVKFLDNHLKAAVCRETAGVFSALQNPCAPKANNKHIALRFLQKSNGIMLLGEN